MATHRKTASGSVEFCVRRKALLPKPLYFTFQSVSAGEEYCAKLERLLDAGIVPEEILAQSRADRRGESPALGKLVRDYLAAVAVKPEDAQLLALIITDQPGLRLGGITHAWADGWISALKRERKLAPGTVRKYVGALARCLDWGLRRGLLAANPLRTLPRGYSSYSQADAQVAGVRREDVSKDRRLEPGEEDRLRAGLSGPDLLLFTLALETGMRLSEIYTLDWGQVDIPRRTIFLERTKNGSKRQVPLSSVALAALSGGGSGPVLPFFDGDRLATTARLSRRFARSAERAGCPGLRFHDLRHEAICRLYERTTLSDLQIAKVVGHSSTRMLARYANLRGTDLADQLW
jgi:integrase